MKLVDLIAPNAVRADLESTGKIDALAELGALLAPSCDGADAEEITRILVERERLATTGVGDGVAIPHGKTDRLGCLAAAVGISRTGISFDAVDGKPVHVFVALLAPLDSTGEHLKALARVSRMLKNAEFRAQLISAASDEEVLRLFVAEDEKH